MVLGYLISPVVQIVNNHGKPIVGAKIYVYKAGTTNTVNTYRDFSNHYNPTPVLTDTLGNCTIIAPDDMIYDIVVKDNRNNLLMSKDNLTVSSGINPDINLRFNQGYGIIIRKNGNTVTISIDTDVIATKDDLADKQDKLTAGDNIDITNNNIINVVNRKTLYTQWPLKVDRGSSMVKLYLDDDYSNDFKTIQESASYGGSGKYISEISQNENGAINATVLTMPNVPTYTAGSGISIDNNIISCTGDITPYTAGNGISINNHEISCNNAISQYNVSIPNDGTTVTIRENTNFDKFIIEGKYNTTNSNYEIIIRNTNSASRYIKVFPISNTVTIISNGNNANIATAGLYNSVREHIEIFGMGVGTEKPRGEYTIYTDPYVDRLVVTLYEIQPYSL